MRTQKYILTKQNFIFRSWIENPMAPEQENWKPQWIWWFWVDFVDVVFGEFINLVFSEPSLCSANRFAYCCCCYYGIKMTMKLNYFH